MHLWMVIFFFNASLWLGLCVNFHTWAAREVAPEPKFPSPSLRSSLMTISPKQGSNSQWLLLLISLRPVEVTIPHTLSFQTNVRPPVVVWIFLRCSPWFPAHEMSYFKAFQLNFEFCVSCVHRRASWNFKRRNLRWENSNLIPDQGRGKSLAGFAHWTPGGCLLFSWRGVAGERGSD